MRVAWCLAGPPAAPLVVVLGGISGHRRVYGRTGEPAGWWQEIAGGCGGFPSERLQLLSFDYLGGSGETTGPSAVLGRDSIGFPSVDTSDQARLLALLLDHLGITSLSAFVGASYGGMVGLAFAALFPDRLSRLMMVSASDRTDPLSTAWRSVQRQVIRFGASVGHSAEGLRLARALAQATYRSLSESIDLHRVECAQIVVPVEAVAVLQDQLVPIADVRAMAARLPNARLTEISSPFGHDAFLKERLLLQPIFERLLEENE